MLRLRRLPLRRLTDGAGPFVTCVECPDLNQGGCEISLWFKSQGSVVQNIIGRNRHRPDLYLSSRQSDA